MDQGKTRVQPHLRGNNGGGRHPKIRQRLKTFAEASIVPAGQSAREMTPGPAPPGTTSLTQGRELFPGANEGKFMGTILLIVLILVLIGALPTWPYSSGWGYYPAGGLGLILVIILVLVLLGRI